MLWYVAGILGGMPGEDRSTMICQFGGIFGSGLYTRHDSDEHIRPNHVFTHMVRVSGGCGGYAMDMGAATRRRRVRGQHHAGIVHWSARLAAPAQRSLSTCVIEELPVAAAVALEPIRRPSARPRAVFQAAARHVGARVALVPVGGARARASAVLVGGTIAVPASSADDVRCGRTC